MQQQQNDRSANRVLPPRSLSRYASEGQRAIAITEAAMIYARELFNLDIFWKVTHWCAIGVKCEAHVKELHTTFQYGLSKEDLRL